MRKIISIILFFNFYLFINVYAQEVGHDRSIGIHKLNELQYVQPKFVDANKFTSDLRTNIDLKVMYDNFKKNSLMFVYTYYFKINKTGKASSVRFSRIDGQYLKKIKKYFSEDFIKYKWIAGYNKSRKHCKKTFVLKLIIDFDTYQNQMTTEIKTIDQPGYIDKPIFFFKRAM